MSDFVKEIKLSYNAYYCWQEIKHDIRLKMETLNQREVIYAFESNNTAQEMKNFLTEQGLDVIIGEEVWSNFPKGYDIKGFKHYCEYDFSMKNKDPEFIKRDIPKIPIIIRW